MAGCSSCGHPLSNCDCQTYQLPVGPQGEIGATGAAGSIGPAGAVVLTSLTVGVPTTTAAYQTLYTYNVPAATLDEIGDTLVVWAHYTPSVTGTAATRIRQGGNAFTAYGMAMDHPIPSGTLAIEHLITIRRITSTTVSFTYQVDVINNNHVVVLPAKWTNPTSTVGNTTPTTVTNLDTTALALTFEANATTTSAGIMLDYISVWKLEKI